MRTLEKYWDRNKNGGSESYLSNIDVEQFLKIIDDAACDVNFYIYGYCDSKAILSFFEKNEVTLTRDKRLIWNMDETMVSSNKKFKVLMKKKELLLTVAGAKPPHLTACISAAGDYLKLFVIFHNKSSLKGWESLYH